MTVYYIIFKMIVLKAEGIPIISWAPIETPQARKLFQPISSTVLALTIN